MPNINKVVFGSATLIDLTISTLDNANQIVQGVTAVDRGGNLLTGTYVAPTDGDNLGYGLSDRTLPMVGVGQVGYAII